MLVTGIVQNPQEEVKGSSVHDAQISIQELHVAPTLTGPLAIDVQEATMSTQYLLDKDSRNQHVSQRTRLANFKSPHHLQFSVSVPEFVTCFALTLIPRASSRSIHQSYKVMQQGQVLHSSKWNVLVDLLFSTRTRSWPNR